MERYARLQRTFPIFLLVFQVLSCHRVEITYQCDRLLDDNMETLGVQGSKANLNRVIDS